ncbi:WcaI family glycosyltransferase [Klebsiella pneumoniae]|nr:WcaI family glycosyltransferase [Klebsiella pneumoniae]
MRDLFAPSLASFSFSSFFPLLSQISWKPDLVICIAPSLFCAPGTLLLSKLTGCTSVLHIQDFEVDAMLGLGMTNAGMFARLASAFERWCLRSFQYVSTISHSMLTRAGTKGVKPESLLLFPNWSEVERFIAVDQAAVQELRKQLDIPADHQVALYSGNIGEKQGLEVVIEAAKELAGQKILFLIVGNGAGKNKLEALATEQQLTNVRFFPLQPYELLPALLKLADCHLVVQKRGVADAVLPSKLTNILAVGGNAVITAEPDTELGRLCLSYPGIGVCVEPEQVDALVTGIKEAMQLPAENRTAKDYARQNLAKENVLQNFIQYFR